MVNEFYQKINCCWVRFLDETILNQTLITSQSNSDDHSLISLKTGGLTQQKKSKLTLAKLANSCVLDHVIAKWTFFRSLGFPKIRLWLSIRNIFRVINHSIITKYMMMMMIMTNKLTHEKVPCDFCIMTRGWTASLSVIFAHYWSLLCYLPILIFKFDWMLKLQRRISLSLANGHSFHIIANKSIQCCSYYDMLKYTKKLHIALKPSLLNSLRRFLTKKTKPIRITLRLKTSNTSQKRYKKLECKRSSCRTNAMTITC